MKGRVTVRLRPGVLDVQGKAIAHALADLGFGETEVRVGKVFEVSLDAADPDAARARLTEMADKLLANPVMESFEIEVE
ncbi:MAG: phosphoribosylformylglycinamidine synthase subunit PurS [Myxococcales bacterium]|nr:phosphoribosylformylglycinamidine synthase subunit PurS [Myxococcales bacterium]MCB9538382.1 phosphoribosylformylglycinamidine synthase subunit PurS [Myxococcales bacterium]